MAAVLTVVRFGHKSGLIEDEIVNTFSVLTPSPGFVVAEAQAFGADLWDFYTAAQAITGNSVVDWLSPVFSKDAGAVKMDYYDLTGHLDGSRHGSPARTDVHTLPAT